ncbi:MAG: sulfite exporter TauE/SafE family protein [Marmoricola sp.]
MSTDLSLLQESVVLLSGFAAGAINTVVGSGTLITFPTLLAFGVPPVTANVSNTLGLVPGSLSGAIGYRAHLVGQRDRILRLIVATTIGAAIGATLLLVLPSGAFRRIVPLLIVVGLALVVLGPRLSARAAARAAEAGWDSTPDAGWVPPAVLGAGVYGGYFGAAQGVIMLGILGAGVHEPLQRQNAVKNIVVASSNSLAAVIFIFSGHIDWLIAGLLAVGAAAGGQLGAHLGRRLPAPALRAFILVVGVTALVAFLV